MNNNVGAVDGAIRTLLFIISICYGILSGHYLWMIPGGILFATAVITWCPIYAIIGADTHKNYTSSH